MSDSFTRTLTGYRRAQTLTGDTPRRIAVRELSDAARWYDLVSLNDLLPPYLTDDDAQAGPRVLRTGRDTILVPTSAPTASGVSAPTGADDLFGTDLLLVAGRLDTDGAGDLAVVSGLPNLRQALAHRLATRLGELIYHQGYGCGTHDLIGARGDGIANSLAALFVRQALREDPRVTSTEGVKATVNGDSIPVEGTAIVTDGRRVPVGSA